MGAYISLVGGGVPVLGAFMFNAIYKFPAYQFNCTDGAHQQDLDRRLPRRRPAGGDVRHRADHGRARRRGRRGPAGDPGEELDQARGVPVHHGLRAWSTTPATTRPPPPRPRRCSATTSCAPSSSGAASAKDPVQLGIGISTFTEMCGLAPVAGARLAQLRRRRLGARGGPDAADRQGRGGHRGLAARPGPRDGLVADRRRPARRARSRTSRCCTATPRSPHKGMDTYGSRSLVVGGEALVRAADKVIEKAKPIAAHLLEASDDDLEFKARQVRRQGHRQGHGDRRDRARGLRRAQPARRGGAHRCDSDATFDPDELLVPARHPPVRDGGRHRDRRHRRCASTSASTTSATSSTR